MQKQPLDLTIAVPVLNEEHNLKRCLGAIGKKFVQAVVVIDSGSTDNTKEIATGFGVEVINFIWDGKFPKKRNWFLRNYPLKTKWILFLDADEYITEDFKKELCEKLSDNDKVGYWLRYSIYFMGKKLKGGYPLQKLALFRAGGGEYEQINEQQWSNLDMEVHEHPVLNGNIGVIRSKIDHWDFRGVKQYVIKHNEYASWEAARFLRAASDPEITSKWTWKQKIKYGLLRSSLIGPAYFFGSFFLLGGFRDGARGFAFAILKMSYFTQIYCKIREMEGSK